MIQLTESGVQELLAKNSTEYVMTSKPKPSIKPIHRKTFQTTDAKLFELVDFGRNMKPTGNRETRTFYTCTVSEPQTIDIIVFKKRSKLGKGNIFKR